MRFIDVLVEIFAFLSGGRIDHAHHDGFTKRSLEETKAMDDAVKTGQSLTSEEDTLMVVTADHSHSFVSQGYPSRGNAILGKWLTHWGIVNADR